MNSLKKDPLVSIIIVNYNGKEHLSKCLESLSKIEYSNFEMILVDNNSTDDSIEFVKNNYPSIIIIKLEKNYGFAEPNNIGAKNSKGELLLFLNNDTIVTSNFVKEMVDVISSKEKIAICQSLLLKPNGEVDSSGDFVDNLGRAYSSREKKSEITEILSARGASMMVKTQAFWDLGGFDKKFFVSFEDVDLGWRAWLWGYKVVLAPKSIVYHYGKQTIKKQIKEIELHAVKNSIILRLANFEISFALKSIMVLFFVTMMRRIFHISVISDPEPSPPLPSIRTILDGAYWVFKNFGYILNKRKLVNSRRIESTMSLKTKGLIT